MRDHDAAPNQIPQASHLTHELMSNIPFPVDPSVDAVFPGMYKPGRHASPGRALSG
jgi:hypothetical protein